MQLEIMQHGINLTLVMLLLLLFVNIMILAITMWIGWRSDQYDKGYTDGVEDQMLREENDARLWNIRGIGEPTGDRCPQHKTYGEYPEYSYRCLLWTGHSGEHQFIGTRSGR